MSPRHSLNAAAIVTALALAAGGCGAKQPQPPPERDQDISAALEGIAHACGEAYQAGHGEPSLERAAAANSRKLADVYRQNPSWNYQSGTVAQLVTESVSYLRECGLTGAAATLRAATR
jgi:hypothetical protein